MTVKELKDDARYRLLVDAIVDYAVYMLDADGRVVSWNPGAQRFKGYAAEEIVGAHFSRFYTPEDRETGLPERALAAADREGRFENEGWRLRKDGSRFWAHVIIDPIRGEDGNLIGFAKITRDLTERREAAESLKRSQAQFEILVNGVTDYALYMLDRDGRVSSWNVGAERIKGYARDEIVGSHFSKFYTPEEREAGGPAHTLGTAEREGRFEGEGWRLRKDGTRFWAHVVVDAIHDDEGELIGFAKITRDITERMEAQKALEQAREALFQSQKLEAIGQLTGGVAHDFNNLLSAVLGSLDLVRKRLPHDPRISPLIDNAILGAERGAQLTQRMLAFARKQELSMEPVDLAARVSGLLDFLRRTIGPAFEIQADFPPNLPSVRTDPVQLDSALLNLVVNARDAMPDGGVIRMVAATEATGGPQAPLSPGGYVRLSLSDQGEGMDPDTLARAADPFFTTKGVGKGTGLGLPMVHGLMHQSGGRLDLRSLKGEGTTVDLWLPVVAAPSSTPERADRSGTDREERILDVLAVDDDPLVLTNTAALLEDLGHRVTTARSGARALELLRSRLPVDLLITDQVMPQMTGVALLEEAKRVRPTLRTIVASGYADLAEASVLKDTRLPKPFTQGELKIAIATAVAD